MLREDDIFSGGVGLYKDRPVIGGTISGAPSRKNEVESTVDVA